MRRLFRKMFGQEPSQPDDVVTTEPRDVVQSVVSGDRVVVIDFETSGLSPAQGDRVIEVGAVALVGGRIVDRFSSLVNPGFRVSSFIEGYTGISNRELASAPSSQRVFPQLRDFVSGCSLVAHNAAFDGRFLAAEMARINHHQQQSMACSMLISRRVYPDLGSHSLENLVRVKSLPTDGNHHRALADAEMTAHLWIRMVEDLRCCYGLDHVPFDIMLQLAKVPKTKVKVFLSGRCGG